MLKFNPAAQNSPNLQNWPITSKVNGKGRLEVGGCDLVDLAREFGTPLYVVDEATFRTTAQKYTSSFKAHYGNAGVLYASKALNNMALCRMADQEGLYLDTVSGGELYTALQAKFPAERIFFHGNNKTVPELELAVSSQIGYIVVDNFDELELLREVCKRLNKRATIMMRVTPGISAHTHEFIQTGQEDSKFGFDIKEQILEAVKIVLSDSNLTLAGLHAHIGSQIFDLNAFGAEVEVMIHLYDILRKQFNITLKELDLGGGLGIQYTQSDDPPTIESYAEALASAVKAKCKEFNYPEPRIYCEPGRSMIATAGVTLYSIGSSKTVPGVRKYVAIDGGMTDNPRPITYGAVYEAVLANKANVEPQDQVTVAGRCCESGDILIRNIALANPQRGDILAVAATGAYNYAMSSNYNRVGRPAMVLAKDGKGKLILKRESYEDLIRNDLLPDDLK